MLGFSPGGTCATSCTLANAGSNCEHGGIMHEGDDRRSAKRIRSFTDGEVKLRMTRWRGTVGG
jgi:hypothetical protein